MTEKRSATPLIAVVHSWSVEKPVMAAGADTFSVSDMTDARAAIKWADGIVLTGGGDVDPKRYSDWRHPDVYGVDYDRDELEFFIAKKARGKNIPIMGICRGHQLLNVAYGGTLVQHIKDSYTDRSHWGGGHTVRVRRKSAVGRAIDNATIYGTSLHHQAIERVGRGLIATGWTDDGHIEMIESIPGLPQYVLGTQFHPEMDYHEYDSNPAFRIFKHFVEVASKKAFRRRLNASERNYRALDESGQSELKEYLRDMEESKREYETWWKEHGSPHSATGNTIVSHRRYGWENDAWWEDDLKSEEQAAEHFRHRKAEMDITQAAYDPIKKIWIPFDEWSADDEFEAQRDKGEVNREEACNAICEFPPCVHPFSCDPYEGECWARAVASDRANERVGPQYGSKANLAVVDGKRGNGRAH